MRGSRVATKTRMTMLMDPGGNTSGTSGAAPGELGASIRGGPSEAGEGMGGSGDGGGGACAGGV